MKGFFFARNIDWQYAHAMLGERNAHLYLQYLLLGLNADLECHWVVPTQWGLVYSEERTQLLRKLWQGHGHQEVFEKQERCMTCCAACLAELKYCKTRPYQMALRIVVGHVQLASPREDDEASASSWQYDLLLGMLCYRCQTAPWHTLVQTDLHIYPVLCAALKKWAFADALRSNDELAAQYLERIDRLNDCVPLLLAATQGARCAHCQLQSERIVDCSVCHCVAYCVAGDCARAASFYHSMPRSDDGMCERLKKGNLFHTLDALYIDILSGEAHGFAT